MLKFEEQFPEAIGLLSRALRAGHALTTGLSMVAEEMPAPIAAEIQTLYDQQNFGLSLSQALRNFAERIPSLDARFFVTAVLTQKEAGGNLSEVLDNLASIVRDRFKVKRQVRVISAHGRITGSVLVGAADRARLVLRRHEPGKIRDLLPGSTGYAAHRGCAVPATRWCLGHLANSENRGLEVSMSLQIAILLVAVFVSIALAVGAIASQIFRWSAPEQREIEKLGQPALDGVFYNVELTEVAAPWVKHFQQVAPKSPKEMSELRRRLTAAGYRSLTAAVLYGAAEMILPFVLCRSHAADGRSLEMVHRAVCRGPRLHVPGFWLSRKTTLRQKQIRNGLPDALDLMIVCIEAGSGIDQSLVKTSDELDISYPALAEELRLITTEMRAGKPRLEAFKNFASRTKVDEVRSLVSMLVQTDRFGTSIAMALRTHAEVARTKRRQNAEERAAKIGVKLVFPLVFCLFPSLYVAILGPAVVDYVRVFKPGISNSSK